MTPFIALVPDDETFDAATHSRRDLTVFSLSKEQNEGELATSSFEIQNPKTSLSVLEDQRVFISYGGNLIFDGRLSYVPQGSVDSTVTLSAISTPEDLEQKILDVVEGLKNAPGYNPLFVPEGEESTPEEVLAGYPLVLAYSSTGGGVQAVDALGGATDVALMPLDGSLRFENVEKVASKYGVAITAKWKQLGLKTFSNPSWFRDLTTMNPEEVVKKFPKKGSNIGSSFSVVEASASEELDAFGRQQRKVVENIRAVSRDELDPVFIEEGSFIARASLAPIAASLKIEHRYEVERTEKCSFTVPVDLQAGAQSDEEEIEEISLRDLTDPTDAQPWKAKVEYLVDDEVVFGSDIFRAREDHLSGNDFDRTKWLFVGEASYFASRRLSSFFTSQRGQEAIAHAVERVKARAKIASRSVHVSFEAAMPDPSLITEDCTVTLAHPKIPGGTITGRLISYQLLWSEGQAIMSGTIAAAAGTGSTSEVSVDAVDASPEAVSGHVSVSISNAGQAQEEAFLNGQSVPPTKIQINTTPSSAGNFAHEASVTISGSISIPQQVIL